MEAAGLTLARKRHLHRRALRLEYFTVAWNVIEAVVAITAGVIVGSVALIGFGAFAVFGWASADPVGALLMLPVILWQGWETLEEAREGDD
jgi:divalent metal cation (Fe/Co/Zn/Cd) transporter